MDTSPTVISDYARELFAAHGAKAIAEAAEKVRRFEKQGNREQAEVWRQVEDRLKAMRGPHVS